MRDYAPNARRPNVGGDASPGNYRPLIHGSYPGQALFATLCAVSMRLRRRGLIVFAGAV
jgi:hypothetical protein